MFEQSGSMRDWPQDLTAEERALLEELDRGSTNTILARRIFELFTSDCSEGFRKIVTMRLRANAMLRDIVSGLDKKVREVNPREFLTTA